MQAKTGIAAFIVRPLLTPLLTCPRSRSSLEKRPALRLEGRPKTCGLFYSFAGYSARSMCPNLYTASENAS